MTRTPHRRWVLGGYWTVRIHGTQGEHSLRSLGTARVGLGGPRPAQRPGMAGSRTLGYWDATGCGRRAENGVGARGLDLAWS